MKLKDKYYFVNVISALDKTPSTSASQESETEKSKYIASRPLISISKSQLLLELHFGMPQWVMAAGSVFLIKHFDHSFSGTT